MAHSHPPQSEKLILRRAPKVAPFLVVGAVVGVTAALIMVSLVEISENYTFSSTFAFFAALFAIFGVAIAALIWLILDRRSKKNLDTLYAREVTDPAEADPGAMQFTLSEYERSEVRRRAEASANAPKGKKKK